MIWMNQKPVPMILGLVIVILVLQFFQLKEQILLDYSKSTLYERKNICNFDVMRSNQR